jgi:hypothetical protein
VAAALAASGWLSSTAAAATEYGNDVSWPQCTTAQGGAGLPMPADSAQFVVIGLTRGLPFTDNPCLADQVTWAKTRSKPAQAYTFAAFPTDAQLASYGSQGPWSPTTRLGRLSNVGYAEGTWALGRLTAVGFTPSMVWVDVEPRDKQPWPTGSRQSEAENRAVISGLLRRLDAGGYSYGLYANASGWKAVTGTWWLPGIPAWVTVGRKTATEAAAACQRPGVTSGTPRLAQWFDDTRDSDLTCVPFRPAPAVAYPTSGPNDLNGDWNGDLLSRERAGGDLLLYTGGLPMARIGSRWSGMNLIDTAGDLTGDGVPDVIAREAATGRLWVYPRSGGTGWQDRLSIGPGWNGMTAVVAAGDFNGDRIPDLLARAAGTSGLLFLYAGTGAGTVKDGVQIGNGWAGFDRLLAPGDFDGDGNVDVLARSAADGSLWLYRGDGAGGWLSWTRIGSGWAPFDLLAAPGDITGDVAADVVARDPRTGKLWLYPTDGAGHWLAAVDLGTAWSGMDALS